ncbi:MAG: ATP-binding cassette domain-containing protein [Desulfobacteraceae bacterium]|jgi:peptide/nickel transport system ATP-binding protein/oligopeptide transport system ATP-binding protein
MEETILRVTGLRKHFRTSFGFFLRSAPLIKAVDGVSFQVWGGETFGIVGESGCGKSTLGKTILGIYRPTEGSVIFKGKEITNVTKKENIRVRRDMQYVYQDPGSSLDPRWKTTRILSEPLVIHTSLKKEEIKRRVEEMMEAVGLGKEHFSLYPHEFSGGQQRRLGLARILCLNPTLVILDEPTSGLDVSVQATILKLFLKLKKQFDLTYMFISHNLSVIQMMCERVAVMYAGKIVEMGQTRDIFANPIHPYTQVLLAAIPLVGKKKEKVLSLTGEPPNPSNFPMGCRFWPRCSHKKEMCETLEPELHPVDQDRMVCCHLFQ